MITVELYRCYKCRRIRTINELKSGKVCKACNDYHVTPATKLKWYEEIYIFLYWCTGKLITEFEVIK